MYIRCSLVAIFVVFILCVHCENGANYNEVKNLNLPTAPQNLTAYRVSSDEIYLSWVPPTNFIGKPIPKRNSLPQADAPQPPIPDNPDLSVIPKIEGTVLADSPVLPEKPALNRDWYNNDRNYNDEYSTSDIMNDFRSRRELKTHRHRKRRQNTNSTETEKPIEVVKKSSPSHMTGTKIAYVLYYEQGMPMNDAKPVVGVPSSDDVRRMNAFPSDLGIENREHSIKNLTLLNNAGVLTKVVAFRLKNLRSFTAYKIWVKAAFYNFSLDAVMDRLGPQSEALYVLTDVRAPSSPVVLNLTCELTKTDDEISPSAGKLYLTWRQPMVYDNTLDQYVVTLRRLPENQPRTRLTLPTLREDIETTISVTVELQNVTRYEVKIYAVTLSVAKPHLLVNGTESPPEEVSSSYCEARSQSMPADKRAGSSDAAAVALLAALPIALLVALASAAVYWRCRARLGKCLRAAYSYLEEGGERAARAPLNAYKKPAAPTSRVEPPLASAPASGPRPRPPRMAAPDHPARNATEFVKHVAALHADGDIGFSKEYEIVVSKSAALGHTSHYSHRPENRLKNRYLNITAYDHSRVCVSTGGQCGAAGCAGGGGPAGGAPCGYVNANYIDGIKPTVDAQLKKLLERKAGKVRQPSIKPPKPPVVLAEGIEAAFLNIEFGGVAESDRRDESDGDSDSDSDDGGDTTYDAVVDVDGTPTPVKLEWLVWRRRYIATQGPTPATLDAFWLMVCQHDVHTIVMITNLVERGRRKCDMYWPSGGRGSSAQFGAVRVTLLSELVRAAYTVRHLKAQWPTSSGGMTERIVAQYHYTMWPDHGTPRHPLAVLPFVRRAAAAPGAILVHCSAGVGRTGTFIVLAAQLAQLRLAGALAPLGFLCRARTQRNHLVQTEEQYVFVHDALLEHVRSGDTAIPFEDTRSYLVKLLQPISEDELAVLDFSRHKSVNDLTNGYEHNETASLKSKEDSQVSIKTDDLSKSSSVKELNEDEEKDKEDVYDLAPRSTDTYSKKMAAYNNMSEEEKEEVRRANRAENYAILERMRSLSNRSQYYQGPPPVNLLEKQFQLISRSCAEPAACARLAHNAEKNRSGAALPSDAARVLLVPKPGVDGSEYINASWVCGLRRLREYAVAQHPSPTTTADLWRLLWDHTAQLVLTLSAGEEDCDVFWPTEEDKELYVANFRASFVSKDVYIARRKSERPAPPTPPEPTAPEPAPAINGYRRQESECADDECLIPENSSPIPEAEPAYRFDRTELRLERLSTGSRDLSARKSIANGDLFSSFSEKRSGPKSPRSPSKMSLKNFKLSSPTKFKFPEWGSRAGSPPNEAPPPPPVVPSLSVEQESELRRPCYYFEKVETIPEGTPQDKVIEVTNVSVHSLQDDYQLNVKFIKCSNWFESDTTDYKLNKPDDNAFVKAIREAISDEEREKAIDRLIEPFKDSFGLIEFVAGCQMEYKNGPVVVVDKFGDWKALSFCILSAACGGARDPRAHDPNAQFEDPSEHTADIYCASALAAHARCTPGPPGAMPLLNAGRLLAMYAALASYSQQLGHLRSHEDNQNGEPTLTLVS